MKKTILLVDDVQMFIEIEKEFLRYSQVEIVSARDGVQAMHVAKSRQPDLIFMDLQMPNMDGATCCRTMKSDPSLKEIPVVMVTTKGKEEDRQTCFSAGCNDFLTKPLYREHFLEAARKFVPGIERRERRVPVSICGFFSTSDAASVCTLRDLSVGGTFVATDYAGLPGSVIRVSFALPDGTEIDCQGRIAWVNRAASKIPVGFGVKFSMLTKQAKDSLATFVESFE